MAKNVIRLFSARKFKYFKKWRKLHPFIFGAKIQIFEKMSKICTISYLNYLKNKQKWGKF